MPRIAVNFIRDRLIPAVNIEAFIGQYVTLKRQSSNNYTCCCPFHHEKTPSFVVTPSKQMFYCFGCKEHGNAIDFVMKFKNLSFVEAVEEVAQFAGLNVEYEQGSGSFAKADTYKLYYELMDRCASYFVKCLNSSPEGKDYFIKKRELSEDTIIKARLGYAPDSWDYIHNIAKNTDEYKKLIELGMVVDKGDRSYAMFRGRVMIPIIDGRGRVISFGGRTLGDSKPKYLNTAESPIFRKRHELFGLYEALQANRNRPARIVIVEGYMDVIALRQFGCSFAVASLGTATTKEQMELMFRYTKQVVCCYDGDFAGRNAAWHALETATSVLKADREIRFAFLPPEHDPDSLVRKEGLSAFTRTLDASLSYPEFLIKHISDKYDLSDPGQKSPFLNEVLYFIRRIPEMTLQAVCVSELARKAGLEEELLYEMLKSVRLNSRDEKELEKESAPAEKSGTVNLLTTPMRRLIAFILQQPTLVSTVYERFNLDKLQKLCKDANIKGNVDVSLFLNLIKEKPDITPAGFIETVRGSVREKYVRNLIEAEFIPKKADGSEFSPEVRAELFSKIIKETLGMPLKQEIERLRLRGDSITKEEMEAMSLLNRMLTKHGIS